jgi:hypothetical protein
MEIEVFVILVLSAFSLTQLLLRRDEFNALDPLGGGVPPGGHYRDSDST